MDVLKEFEEYLPRWSEEKHQPIPTKKHMDRWYKAWNDFVQEVLKDRYQEMCDMYRNMPVKRKGQYIEPQVESVQEPIEEEVKVEEPQSEWERVQKYLKD